MNIERYDDIRIKTACGCDMRLRRANEFHVFHRCPEHKGMRLVLIEYPVGLRIGFTRKKRVSVPDYRKVSEQEWALWSAMEEGFCLGSRRTRWKPKRMQGIKAFITTNKTP